MHHIARQAYYESFLGNAGIHIPTVMEAIRNVRANDT